MDVVRELGVEEILEGRKGARNSFGGKEGLSLASLQGSSLQTLARLVTNNKMHMYKYKQNTMKGTILRDSTSSPASEAGNLWWNLNQHANNDKRRFAFLEVLANQICEKQNISVCLILRSFMQVLLPLLPSGQEPRLLETIYRQEVHRDIKKLLTYMRTCFVVSRHRDIAETSEGHCRSAANRLKRFTRGVRPICWMSLSMVFLATCTKSHCIPHELWNAGGKKYTVLQSRDRKPLRSVGFQYPPGHKQSSTY